MPGARRRRLEREAAAALPACARGRGASATATAVAAESAPPSRPARVSPLAQLRSRCARPRPLRGRRRRCSCTSSGLARHCNRSPSRHARRVMKGPWRRRSLAPLGIRPRLRIGAKVNGGRFTWPKFDKKKKKASRRARRPPRPASAVCGWAARAEGAWGRTRRRRGPGPRRPAARYPPGDHAPAGLRSDSWRRRPAPAPGCPLPGTMPARRPHPARCPASVNLKRDF